MTIETVTYISDFNSTYPVDDDAANHPASLGDDHIRNLKIGLKGTFPNVAGAVTASTDELNFVDGVTSSIQTQINSKTGSYHVTAGATQTLSAKRLQLFTPTATTVSVTLPASPTVGDIIFVVNPRSWSISIVRNGTTINNASNNLGVTIYSIAVCVYGPAGNWTVDQSIGE